MNREDFEKPGQPNGQGRTEHRRKRQSRERKKMIIRILTLPTAGILCVCLAALLVLPFFTVRKIEVKGNVYYTEEQIAEKSGIVVGSELFAAAPNEIARNLMDAGSGLGYLSQVSVRISLFGTVTLAVSEVNPVMLYSFNGRWYAVDREMRVLERKDGYPTDHVYIEAVLPEVRSLSVGGKLNFENTDTDYSYIGDFLSYLEEKELLSSVSRIDFSQKYNISFTIGQACTVIVGEPTDLDAKIDLMGRTVEARGGNLEGIFDVSDGVKCVWRSGESKTEIN